MCDDLHDNSSQPGGSTPWYGDKEPAKVSMSSYESLETQENTLNPVHNDETPHQTFRPPCGQLHLVRKAIAADCGGFIVVTGGD